MHYSIVIVINSLFLRFAWFVYEIKISISLNPEILMRIFHTPGLIKDGHLMSQGTIAGKYFMTK